jgi:quercetin dioxygenase-like cupin family protein
MRYQPAGGGEVVVATDYEKRVLFSSADFPDPGHLLQVVTISPGTTQRRHFHHDQTEVFFILAGDAEIVIDGRCYRVAPEDAFICSPGEVHHVCNNTAEDVRILVFKLRLPEEGTDTTWHP